MKRKNYIVSYSTTNGVQKAPNWVGSFLKHAWNSAIREVEAHIAQIAKEDGCEYNLTSKESVKLTGDFGFFCGNRVWTGANGNVITFEIQRLEE